MPSYIEAPLRLLVGSKQKRLKMGTLIYVSFGHFLVDLRIYEYRGSNWIYNRDPYRHTEET